jgi:NAD(P)-dependent dehydrogenase (short-subunit alcohol dehydrogenase family)
VSKVFFLTGSGVGLGRSIAEAVLRDGHQLVATALEPDMLNDLVGTYGKQILPLQLDVTDFASAQDIARSAVEVFGRIDVVINNAGFSNSGSIEDMPLTSIEAQVNTNFLGTVKVTKAVLPVLREQGHGHIIQISSIGDRTARPGSAVYFASKWAIAGFSECLAQEVAPLGIKVTIIEANMMRTQFFAQSVSFPSHPAYDNTVGATVRMKKSPEFLAKLGDPEKVVKVILKVTELADPPLRLLVGADAFKRGKEADAHRAKEDDRWQWLGSLADT